MTPSQYHTFKVRLEKSGYTYYPDQPYDGRNTWMKFLVMKKGRKAVAKSDIMNRAIVAICYPAKELKDVWIRRLANRGNSEEFLSLIEQNYDKWIEDIERETAFYKEKLYTENSYLGSYLYRIGL